jgi:CRP-like cAMP-binding protein
MDQLFEYITKRIKLSDDAKELIRSVTKIRNVKKGEYLINQGQNIVNQYFFVISGCLRSFSFDPSGKEHTVQFAIKDWWISDYLALYSKEKASLTIECLSDCTIIETNTVSIEKVFKAYPIIETFHRKNLETRIVSLSKRILNQLQLSSLEKYKLFVKEFPNIENNALNYHIASYLGITQQSLSRLRKEFIKK